MTKTYHVSSRGKPDPALSELKLIRYSQQCAVRALQMRGLKRLATILPSQESEYAMSDLA